MLNKIILGVLLALIAATLILSLAELIFKRNSGGGKFTRFFLIRIREISMTKAVVTSLIMLLFRLVAGDDNLMGVFMFIVLLFCLLFAAHPEYLFVWRRHRKKAKKSKRAPEIVKTLTEAALAKDAAVLAELVPAAENDSQ